jgi:hypothetical protein
MVVGRLDASVRSGVGALDASAPLEALSAPGPSNARRWRVNADFRKKRGLHALELLTASLTLGRPLSR